MINIFSPIPPCGVTSWAKLIEQPEGQAHGENMMNFMGLIGRLQVWQASQVNRPGFKWVGDIRHDPILIAINITGEWRMVDARGRGSV